MELKKTIGNMIEVNLRLITTDRDLQKFMVGAFSLLLIILLYCAFFGDFQQAERYFTLADKMLSGTVTYGELNTDLPPLTLLLLIIPRLVSPTPEVYCYMFSLYGFAFYMLGGHFMLKSCRETGSSQRSAYVCLFITFVCSFYFMTLSTGSFAPAFVIIALWFYHLDKYTISLTSLALATMSGLYPAILFVIMFFHLLRTNRLREARFGALVYIMICTALTAFSLIDTGSYFHIPFLTVPDSISEHAVLYLFYNLLGNANPVSEWAIALTSGPVIGIVYALQLRKDSNGMRPIALIQVTCLIVFAFLSPAYSPRYYIWIAMLVPMTQMYNCIFMEKKKIWVSFIAFSATTAACDFLLPIESISYEIASIIRIFSILALLVYLDRDCQEYMGPRTRKSLSKH